MDSAHSHDPSPGKKSPLWPIFVGGLAMLLAFWILAKILVDANPAPADEESERGLLRAKNLAELKAENEKHLTTYSWVDKTKGSVRIPIKEAMNLVGPQLNAVPPHAAYPVAPAPAAAPSAPTPAAAPSPQPASR